MQFFFYAYTTQIRYFQSIASTLESTLVPSYYFIFILAGMFQFKHLVSKLRYSVFSFLHSVCEFPQSFLLDLPWFSFPVSLVAFSSHLSALPRLASSTSFHPAVCVAHRELISPLNIIVITSWFSLVHLIHSHQTPLLKDQ